MQAVLGDYVHRHRGLAAVIIGGAPSRLNEIHSVPEPHDAVYFSVNRHGLLAVEELCLLYTACDYIVSADQNMVDELKWQPLPAISTSRSADIRVFESRCANSAILACFAAWIMGCAPIIPIGIECYAGKTYAHDPDADSAGFRLKPAQHVERWKLLLDIASGAMIRPAGGPLTSVWPLYDAAEPLCEIAGFERLAQAAAGEKVRFTRAIDGYAAGEKTQVSKSEANRYFAARAAGRA